MDLFWCLLSDHVHRKVLGGYGFYGYLCDYLYDEDTFYITKYDFPRLNDPSGMGARADFGLSNLLLFLMLFSISHGVPARGGRHGGGANQGRAALSSLAARWQASVGEPGPRAAMTQRKGRLRFRPDRLP